jgi:hypothetical protein
MTRNKRIGTRVEDFPNGDLGEYLPCELSDVNAAIFP